MYYYLGMNSLNSNINKSFPEVAKYFRTIDSVYLDNNYLEYLTSNYYYIIYVAVIIFLYIIIANLLKRKKEKQRKIFKINIIEEVHYATCHCKDNPSLLPRCIELLSKYPKICNIPMPVHNYTPFLRACWNGCPELISYMLRIGADITSTTDTGENGIYLATYCYIRRNENSFKALRILIAAGLDVNQARHDGYTPLHLAASRGNSRLVRWLLAEGANPEPNGRPSASRVALACGHTKIAAMLRLPNLKEHSFII